MPKRLRPSSDAGAARTGFRKALDGAIAVLEGKEPMVKCDRVLQELSNYIDEDVDSSLWAAIEEHVRGCHHCSVLVDSTRKMLYVLGDERVFEVPVGYCERLHERLAQHLARA